MSGAQIRIFTAGLIGIIMVGGAFVLSAKNKKDAEVADNTSSVLGTRKHIPVTDSNQDGVPDWQAQIVGKDPIYLDASSTNAYVPSNTLMGEFAIRYYEDVMLLEAAGLLEESEDDLIAAAIAELEEKTEEPHYTRDDLKNVIQTYDPDALRAYGNLVAGNIFYYQTDDEHELEIFSRLIEDNNPKHIEKLVVIEQQYQNIIEALLELEVPEQYVFEHLKIVNSFSALKTTAAALQLYLDDPLTSLVRYRQIYADVLGMNRAVNSLYDALYLDDEIEFAENESLRVLAELLQ